MAASKRKKEVKQKEVPKGRNIAQGGNPERYYSERPAWIFRNADKEMWAFSEENIREVFWTEILPFLSGLEPRTWGDILVAGKKQNHSVDVNTLNKVARDRLDAICIEAESLISLRISGKQRLYGYMTGAAFNILWYDDDHGDNDTCVCRSRLKHT